MNVLPVNFYSFFISFSLFLNVDFTRNKTRVFKVTWFPSYQYILFFEILIWIIINNLIDEFI